MVRYILICLILVAAVNSFAQIIARTEDGRRVLLYEDGTWKFAEKKSESVQTQIKFPAKRKFLHPEFSTNVNGDYYYHQEYDEFNDKSRTSVGVKIREGFYLRFYYYSPGLMLKTVPESVVIMFASASSSRKFSDGTNLKLTLNSEQVDLEKFQHMVRVTPVGIREYVYRDVPLNTFLKILSADYVGGKLFNTEFILTQEHLEAFRDFASRMK